MVLAPIVTLALCVSVFPAANVKGPLIFEAPFIVTAPVPENTVETPAFEVKVFEKV